MPRHPPCALHSLSQQRQNNTRCSTSRHSQRTPDPPPNQRDEPADSSHTATRKETGHSAKIITHSPHTLRACSEDARVHYADLKQQPHQPPHTPDRGRLGEERTPKAQPHTNPPAHASRQCPTHTSQLCVDG